MAKKLEIIEITVALLLKGSRPFIEIYSTHFQNAGARKSEFGACIKDLKKHDFVDYEGNFDDDVDIVLTRFGEQMLENHGNYHRFLKSIVNETLYDKIIKWGKNNIAIAAAMVILIVFSAVAGFWDNLQTIFTPNPAQVPLVSDSSAKSANPFDTVKHSRKSLVSHGPPLAEKLKEQQANHKPNEFPELAKTERARPVVIADKKKEEKVEATVMMNPVPHSAHPNLPTAFTPNGDDVNDTYLVSGGPFQEFKLEIYDRWGHKVFSSNTQKRGWNGTYRHNEQEIKSPQGLYIYRLDALTFDEEKIILTGEVTLIRDR